MGKAHNLLLNELFACESIPALDIEEYLCLRDGSPLRLSTTLRHEGGESAAQVVGESIHGVGCDACDQETAAWNPRFRSMNYALARLSRVSK